MNDRLVNLDFLRGFFVLLALYQHFGYYLNVWYVDYFRDAMALRSTYAIHFPLIGKHISMGSVEYWFALIFTPWVSQIYLTMSAFNLAKREQSEFRSGLIDRLKIFSLIFLFFVLENFIVAPNTGEALSFYPIMLWMVILSAISCLYAFVGIRGILVLMLIATLRFIVPVDILSDFWEEAIRNSIHPGYEYDARIEYFILSGCLGFIMGYVHYHMPNVKNKKNIRFIVMGLIFTFLYYIWGDRFSIDLSNAFATEHLLAESFFGTMYILGIQSIVISLFLLLEKKNIKIVIPVVSWVGINSLFIFSLHRILFVKLIAPVSALFGSLFGYTLSPNTVQLYLYVAIALLLCYFIKNTPISDIIFQKKK